MKKIFLFFVLASLAFGKLNINTATRYELMKFGGLDAGRADMLINFRQKQEITDVVDLRQVVGFENYDTSKLQEIFDFLPKPTYSVETTTEPVVVERVIEKEKVVYKNSYPTRVTRRVVKNYGDITITDTMSYPAGMRHPLPPRYEQPRKSTTTVYTSRGQKRIDEMSQPAKIARNQKSATKKTTTRRPLPPHPPHREIPREDGLTIHGGIEFSYQK